MNRYQGAEMDCVARGAPALTLMVRRLNLLPPSEAALARVLDPLFAPVGRDGIVVLNVGLWYGPLWRGSGGCMQVLTTASFPHRYGPLARLGDPNAADRSAEAEHGGHGAVASTSRRPERSPLAEPAAAEARAHNEIRAHEALDTALDSALDLLSTGVRSLIALACRRTHWPRVIWREHLPQHYAGGGAFPGRPPRAARHANTSAGCMPLSVHEARRLHARVARPAMEMVEGAATSAAAGAREARGSSQQVSSQHGSSQQVSSQGESCMRGARVAETLPAFWPLVHRHMDHPGCMHWTTRDASPHGPPMHASPHGPPMHASPHGPPGMDEPKRW